MSHFATNWAILQRGLKPATKIVLWHLCDRHNPDFGCFPTQARLATDCEISRSALNDHLRKLELAGLIRRCASVDPVTKRQQPTRYILGFEDGFDDPNSDPSPEFGHGDFPGFSGGDPDGETRQMSPNAVNLCPETGHGAVSRFRAKPCPENGDFRALGDEVGVGLRVVEVVPGTHGVSPLRIRIADGGDRPRLQQAA